MSPGALPDAIGGPKKRLPQLPPVPRNGRARLL